MRFLLAQIGSIVELDQRGRRGHVIELSMLSKTTQKLKLPSQLKE